ncbi:hypothetical protein [Sinorhizobium saheli]|uniref:hypothetical protein n=1 Tax=Sinorhizobium saheli TaxID=36856 RepID=UPI001294DF6C|nr:hypothetical protein [Sinorhizobium saheli]MQW86007.1 hypothetical protein [Sinorhizobium saheli]
MQTTQNQISSRFLAISAASFALVLAACSDNSGSSHSTSGLEGKYRFDDGGVIASTLEFAGGGRLVFCADTSCRNWMWEKVDDSRVKISRGSSDFGPALQTCGYIISGTTVHLSGCPFGAKATLTRL